MGWFSSKPKTDSVGMPDPVCGKCNTSKAGIDQEKVRQRESVMKAQASGGFFMGGITPYRDFLQCPACSQVACSSCTVSGDDADTQACPFCQAAYTKASYLFKSDRPF